MSAANDRTNTAATPRGDAGPGWGVGPELRQVLAALGAGLSREGGEHDLPGIFERELQRALAVRTVRLREIFERAGARGLLHFAEAWVSSLALREATIVARARR